MKKVAENPDVTYKEILDCLETVDKVQTCNSTTNNKESASPEKPKTNKVGFTHS